VRNRYRNCYIWNTATPGVYTTTDLGFGQFGSTCWGDSPATSAGARVRWFCNNLVTGGGDQYGDTYTNYAASGSKITIAWTHMVMQARLLSRVQVAIGLLFLQDKDLYYIKTTPFLGWFYIFAAWKRTSNIWD
jgi:hypothetical protein